MSISKNIKLLRKRYRLSQKDLALIAGVSDKAVSTWELGLKEPRMGAIQKIADHFGIKKSNLIEDGGMENLDFAGNHFFKEEALSYNLSDEDHELLSLYHQLDVEDRAEIRGEMKGMLRAEKYQAKNKDKTVG